MEQPWNTGWRRKVSGLTAITKQSAWNNKMRRILRQDGRVTKLLRKACDDTRSRG